MKILSISDYSVQRGGNEIVTLALREGLRVRGHDIRLFASRAHTNGGGLAGRIKKGSGRRAV